MHALYPNECFLRQLHVCENILGSHSKSLRIIDRQLTTLSARWTALQESHDAYVIQCVSDPIEVAVNDLYIDKYCAEFIRLEVACDSFISLHAVDNTATQTAAVPVSEKSSIKLERVKFRTFDGDVRKYPKFKSEFEQFVQPLCSDNQVMFVLKSYLCDSVRREVENCDHDIDAMWARLDAKYGTIRKQIDCIMSDFKNLPECNDSRTTLNMISVVETTEADLKCINASNEFENSTIISFIERSMSKMMFDHWAQKIANDEDADNGKFDKLLRFLQHWKRSIEYNNADIRCSSHVEPVKPSRKCLINREEGHPVWRCRTFKGMTVHERRSVVAKNNACTLCLEPGHNASNCNKSFRCSSPGCNLSHKVLLHENRSDG